MLLVALLLFDQLRPCFPQGEHVLALSSVTTDLQGHAAGRVYIKERKKYIRLKYCTCLAVP